MKGVVMGEELYKGINFEYDQKKLEWFKNKYCDKMVDYLKKALIYGHTSRISS